jgi:hypothetical protein
MPSTKVASAGLAAGAGDLAWSVQSTNFTAVAGNGYYVNTTSAAITITLPATPSVGNSIGIVDYAGTFDTNACIINPNSNKLEGGTINLQLAGDREGVTLNYIDATQGWLCNSGINEGTDALSPPPYSIDFLVIAGGGSGGGQRGAAGGAGGYRTSTQTVTGGTVITVTVGDGGASITGDVRGNNGSNSSISGSGLTTITSTGGGYGGTDNDASGSDGGNGGSGGGAVDSGEGNTAGSGNTPSTSPSQGNNGGTGAADPNYGAGGGGGAGAVGGNGTTTVGGAGGTGTASSITGSSVTRAGGGGGSTYNGGTGGTGGAGGGGAATAGAVGTAGTANTGGGGGGGYHPGFETSGAGGKGVVILSLPTASYSGTSSGSPTVTTSGGNTILQFNGSGSYTT